MTSRRKVAGAATPATARRCQPGCKSWMPLAGVEFCPEHRAFEEVRMK